MSWVKNNTYNLLDRFQVRTQQEIYKFHQINSDFNQYQQSIWIQSERDELNYNIKTMFDEMKEWLGFYPRPIWKKIKVPLDQQYVYWDKIYNIPESAWLNELGVRAVEIIEANVATNVDANQDNVTLTITTDEISNGEVVIFHIAGDAFNNTADDRFRILPSNIYYDGTDYQITIPKARLIKPSLWLSEYIGGDPENRVEYSKVNVSDYSSNVDVYRVYNDSTIKGQLVGPPYDYTSLTTEQREDVNITIINAEDGTFKIQAKQEIVEFEPIHVEVWCYIGYPLTEQNLMNPIIEEFIIRKAKVEMGINARLAAAKISTQWDFDELPAYTKPNSNDSRTGIGYRPNPIGALNVDVEMFKKLMPIANWRGKILDKRFWER